MKWLQLTGDDESATVTSSALERCISRFKQLRGLDLKVLQHRKLLDPALLDSIMDLPRLKLLGLDALNRSLSKYVEPYIHRLAALQHLDLDYIDISSLRTVMSCATHLRWLNLNSFDCGGAAGPASLAAIASCSSLENVMITITRQTQLEPRHLLDFAVKTPQLRQFYADLDRGGKDKRE